MTKSNGFVLKLDELPSYEIAHPTMPELVVTIQPMPKSEEEALMRKVKGNDKIKITTSKRNGFRQKKGDEVQETMELPDVNYVELNKLKAIKTWKKWTIADYPCNEKNITLMFENYFDSHAMPVMNAFEDKLAELQGEEEDAVKN